MAKKKGYRKGSYKYTARRRIALKKAQTISARKRLAAPNKRPVNTSGRRMNTAAMGGKKKTSPLARNVGLTVVAVSAITAGGIVARHKLSGSKLSYSGKGPILGVPVVDVSGSKVRFDANGYSTAGGLKVVQTGVRQLGKPGLLRVGKNNFSYTHRGKDHERILSYNHKPLKAGDIIGRVLKSKKDNSKTATPWLTNDNVPFYHPERIGPNLEVVNKHPVLSPDGDVLVPGATASNWIIWSSFD